MSGTSAQVDKLLTNVSQMLLAEGGICESGILPPLPVGQTTGKLGEYGFEHLDEKQDTTVAGDGQFRRLEPVTYKNQSYDLEKHGLFTTVSEDTYDNVEAPFEAENDATITLSSVLLMEKEQSFQRFCTGLSGAAPSAKWDANSNAASPLKSFETAQQTILDGCGKSPNKAILPRAVYNHLKYNKVITGIFRTGVSGGGPGLATEQEIKAIMDIQNLYIPEISKRKSDTTVEQLWGKNVFFLRSAMSAAKRQVSVGYMLTDRRGTRRVFKHATQNPPNGRIILVGDNYQFLRINSAAGYQVKAVIS